MESSTLMTRIMDSLDNLGKDVRTISERTIRVEDTVKRHDETTFPEMKTELIKQSNSLYRMESKQNEDMAKFVAEKEEIYKRLSPLEADLRKRVEASKDTNSRWRNIFWGGVEKVIYVIIGGTVMYWQIIKTKLDM